MVEKKEVENRIVIMVGEREDTERGREIEEAVGVSGRTVTLRKPAVGLKAEAEYKYDAGYRKGMWVVVLVGIWFCVVLGKRLYLTDMVSGGFESLCYMIPIFIFCGWDVLAGPYMYSRDLRYVRVGGVTVILACVLVVVFVVWLRYGVFEKTDAIFYLFSLLGVVSLGYKEETLKFLQEGILPAYQWRYHGIETLEEITSRAINLKYEKVGVYVEKKFWDNKVRGGVVKKYPEITVVYCEDYGGEDGNIEDIISKLQCILRKANMDAQRLGIGNSVFLYFIFNLADSLVESRQKEVEYKKFTLYLRHIFEGNELQTKLSTCPIGDTCQFLLGYYACLLVLEVLKKKGVTVFPVDDLAGVRNWVSNCHIIHKSNKTELKGILEELKIWGLLYYRDFEHQEYVEMLFEVYRNITTEDALYIRLNALWLERTTPITQMEECIVAVNVMSGLQVEYACILQLYEDMQESYI